MLELCSNDFMSVAMLGDKQIGYFSYKMFEETIMEKKEMDFLKKCRPEIDTYGIQLYDCVARKLGRPLVEDEIKSLSTRKIANVNLISKEELVELTNKHKDKFGTKSYNIVKYYNMPANLNCSSYYYTTMDFSNYASNLDVLIKKIDMPNYHLIDEETAMKLKDSEDMFFKIIDEDGNVYYLGK